MTKMTWKDFKDQVESQGVKDEDVIEMIDLSGSWLMEKVNVFRDKDDSSITIFSDL